MAGVTDVNVRLIGHDNASPAINRVKNSQKGLNVETVRANSFMVRHKRVVQQAGFQVSDFAVQIAGGQSAMLAFTQQGGQMLQFFGPFGAAAAGFLAVFGSIAVVLLKSGKLVGSFKDEMKDLNDVLGVTKTVLKETSLNTEDLIKKYGSASKAIRLLVKSQREVATFELLKGATQVVESFTKGVVTSQSRLMKSTSLGFLRRQTDEYATSLGVSKENARELAVSLQDLGRAVGIEQQLAAVQSMRLALEGSNASFDNMTDSGFKFVQDLNKLESGLSQVVGQMAIIDEQRALEKTSKDLEMATDAAEKMYIGVRDWLGVKLAPILSNVRDDVKDTANAFFEMYDAVVGNSWVPDMVDGIKDHFSRLFSVMVKPASAATDEVSQGFLKLSKSVQSAIGSGVDGIFDAIIDKSKSVSDALRNMGMELAKIAAKSAFFKLLANIAPGIFGAGGFAPLVQSAKGNAFSGGSVTPFANGGVVNGPTMFPMAKGAGLMGEAGPEAILPLTRGRGGRLGVSAAVGGTSVQIINNTPAEVRHETSRGPDGRQMERFTIAAVAKGAARGDLDGSMGVRFGQKPTRVVR